jgi:hypothetical protein
MVERCRLINTSVAPAQRQAIAKSFAQALQSSVNDDPAQGAMPGKRAHPVKKACLSGVTFS